LLIYSTKEKVKVRFRRTEGNRTAAEARAMSLAGRAFCRDSALPSPWHVFGRRKREEKKERQACVLTSFDAPVIT